MLQIQTQIEAPRSLGEAVDLFMSRHVSRLKPLTQKWYADRLGQFVNALTPELAVDRISEMQLDMWYSSLWDERELHANNPYRKSRIGIYSDATRQGHVRAVKKLFNWLRKRRLIPYNPAAVLVLPRIRKKPPRYIPRHELARLLAYFKARDMWKYYAVARLLAATGIRSVGFNGLALADVNVAERWVRVVEKGDKERYAVFDRATADALRMYYRRHRPRGYSAGFFLSGSGGVYRPMTANAFRLALRRHWEPAGLERCYSPHDFRHFFATESVRRGCREIWLKNMMGHESLDTTGIYIHTNVYTLRDEYDQIYGHHMPDLEDFGSQR